MKLSTRPHSHIRAAKTTKARKTPKHSSTLAIKRRMGIKRKELSPMQKLHQIGDQFDARLEAEKKNDMAFLKIGEELAAEGDSLKQFTGLTPTEACFIKNVAIEAIGTPNSEISSLLKELVKLEEITSLEKFTYVESAIDDMCGALVKQRIAEGYIVCPDKVELDNLLTSFNAFFDFFLISYTPETSSVVTAKLDAIPAEVVDEAGNIITQSNPEDSDIHSVHKKYWNTLMKSLFSIEPATTEGAHIPSRSAENIYKRYWFALESEKFDGPLLLELAEIPEPSQFVDGNGEIADEFTSYIQLRQMTTLKHCAAVLESLYEENGFKGVDGFFLAQKAMQDHKFNAQILAYKQMIDIKITSWINPYDDVPDNRAEEDVEKLNKVMNLQNL